jgi:hypothetical protein
VLHSVWIHTGLEPIGIEMRADGSVFVEWQFRMNAGMFGSGEMKEKQIDVSMLKRADDVISEEVRRFNTSSRSVVGFRLVDADPEDHVRWVVIPVVEDAEAD